MKAARFHAKNDIRIDTIPSPPPPASDEVTIDVHWSGICGTDMHEYIQGPVVINPATRPHSLTHSHLPLTMGHEFCGRISAVPDPASESAGTFRLGQPVMVDPRLNCGFCVACTSNSSNLCAQWGFVGLNGGAGGGAGFSEKANIKTRMLHLLPDDVDLDNAALIEPLAVGRHALTVSGISDFSGLNVLVLGGGPVGLAVLFNLRVQGVDLDRVFVSEPTARRAKTVVELGLAREENVFNPLIVDAAKECKMRTENVLGVDMVIDCAGVPSGLSCGMDALKLKGTYVNVAGWETAFNVPIGFAMIKEITIKYAFAYTDEDFRETVDSFVKGKYAGAEKMVSARISLEDISKKGFDELLVNKDEHVKILVTPREELVAS